MPGDSTLASAMRPRRRWAVLGAAACVVAAIVGIAVLMGRRDADDLAGPPPTSGPATVDEYFRSVAPAPEVPFDALRLDGTEWVLRRRAVHPYFGSDLSTCEDQGETDALAGRQIVDEGYGRAGLPWMRVSYVQYVSSTDGADKMLSAIDLAECDSFVHESYERLDLSDGGGVWAEGYRMNDSMRLALVGESGEAILIVVGNDASDETVNDLVGRAAAYLQGDVGEVDPALTATLLDDLIALVGDDPLGLIAEGWTPTGWNVGAFEANAWPVCGPAAAVETAAGAPFLAASYESPDGTEWADARFLLETDAGRRAEIGAAMMAPPGCAPESLAPGEAEATLTDRGGEGVWGRGETYVVAPPSTHALPLVAIVAADLVDRALGFLAPAWLDVPADPLGLERDGWMLVQRTIEPLEYPPNEIPCDAAAGLAEFDGVTEVHDILTPPDGNGLDVDVSVIEVGSLERGNELATAVLAIGDCAATVGADVTTSALSSIRATWFRAGPDFALATIVGEIDLSIVLEIEGDAFDDDLIAELAHRADEFLRTGEQPPTVTTVPTTTRPPDASATDVVVRRGGPIGVVDREPEPGELLLWVSNQSRADNPVQVVVDLDGTVIVDEEFTALSGHEWVGYFVADVTPGTHRLRATSSTGVSNEFGVSIVADRPTWATLDYFRASNDTSGRKFEFRESDAPIGFA